MALCKLFEKFWTMSSCIFLLNYLFNNNKYVVVVVLLSFLNNTEEISNKN